MTVIESGETIYRVYYTLKCFLIKIFLIQLFDWLNKRYMGRGGMGVQYWGCVWMGRKSGGSKTQDPPSHLEADKPGPSLTK